jgi:hypothetical protein
MLGTAAGGAQAQVKRTIAKTPSWVGMKFGCLVFGVLAISLG